MPEAEALLPQGWWAALLGVFVANARALRTAVVRGARVEVVLTDQGGISGRRGPT